MYLMRNRNISKTDNHACVLRFGLRFSRDENVCASLSDVSSQSVVSPGCDPGHSSILTVQPREPEVRV